MPRHSFIYLASQSPRRQQLLEQLGVKFELLLPDANEDAEALETVLPHEKPRAYVQRVTAKARSGITTLKAPRFGTSPRVVFRHHRSLG